MFEEGHILNVVVLEGLTNLCFVPFLDQGYYPLRNPIQDFHGVLHLRYWLLQHDSRILNISNTLL
jgi:hypothetical protein